MEVLKEVGSPEVTILEKRVSKINVKSETRFVSICCPHGTLLWIFYDLKLASCRGHHLILNEPNYVCAKLHNNLKLLGDVKVEKVEHYRCPCLHIYLSLGISIAMMIWKTRPIFDLLKFAEGACLRTRE